MLSDSDLCANASARVAPQADRVNSVASVAAEAATHMSTDVYAILDHVARSRGVPTAKLLHHSRCARPIAEARQMAMYLLHICTGRSMSDVGRALGRDRTTVRHACAAIEDRRDEPEFDDLVTALEGQVEAIFTRGSRDRGGRDVQA